MRHTLSALCFAAALLISSTSLAAPAQKWPMQKWVATWATSQMIPTDKNILPPADLTDATLRQVVRVSKGGHSFRLRLSNLFGTAPLTLDAVHVAHVVKSGAPAIDPSSDVAVTFDGSDHVVIPAGADYLSDPITFTAPDLSDIAISLHLDQPPAVETSHPGSRANSWLVHGAHSTDADLTAPEVFAHWFFLSSLEVDAKPTTRAIVTFGDSITDGYGLIPDTNLRWSDTLARRIAAAHLDRTVLNSGIGGNRLLLDGLGPSALARFDREVLSQTGVRYVIVLEGVNDLGMLTRDAPATPEAHAALVAAAIGAYRQMIDSAHVHGIKIYGSTIMPFTNDYYHPTAVNEADRQAINAWIRTQAPFDAIIDFDQVMRDPANPGRLNPAYDSGDHLHPSTTGYGVMGEAIPLSLFRK